MFIKASVLIALAVAVAARPETPSYSPSAHPAPSYSPPSPSYNAPTHDVPAQYNTQYVVNDEYSGNNYGHQENRDGYNTQGTYYVQLPDGRLQKVTYYVDGESGYVAEVTYEGEAQYPAYQPAPSTSYQPAPSPSYA
ncbi:cuticle protein 19.8-like [Penaeus indicus]|uniref:cuticle protein 19.8-like n=1 Tax=Penaeus indicus TaxID=29960 RepID=UPI00300D8951